MRIKLKAILNILRDRPTMYGVNYQDCVTIKGANKGMQAYWCSFIGGKVRLVE